jgi:hypothetical protein
MHRSLWLASLWPGLAQAWLLGRWGGLILAVLSGAALDVAVLTTLAWPQWPVRDVPVGTNAAAAWLLVLGFWIVGIVQLRSDSNLLRTNATPAPADPQLEAWLREAQHSYLKGHWIETETLLKRLLAVQPHDIESRLLLASVQRQTQRWQEAEQTLVLLSQNSAAAPWRLEIDSELMRIEELVHPGEASNEDLKLTV